MYNSKVVYLDLPRPVDPADIELENGILEGFRQLPDYLQDAGASPHRRFGEQKSRGGALEEVAL